MRLRAADSCVLKFFLLALPLLGGSGNILRENDLLVFRNAVTGLHPCH